MTYTLSKRGFYMNRLFKDIIIILVIAFIIHFLIRFVAILLELFRTKLVYFIFGTDIGNVILGL